MAADAPEIVPEETAKHTPRDEREFDVVVYGATGYTGQNICRQFMRLAPSDALRKWAISGRSQGYLDALAAELRSLQRGRSEGEEDGQNAAVESHGGSGGDSGATPIPTIVVVDVEDGTNLRALFGRARVVVNVCGPYGLFSEHVVTAAIDSGTDYVDVTGESNWVREMVFRHHQSAEARGVLLVHQCGYDSTVADYGVEFAREMLSRKGHGAAVSCAGYFVVSGTPTLTNGTARSGLEAALGNTARLGAGEAPEGCPPVPRAPTLRLLPKDAHFAELPGVPAGVKAKLGLPLDPPVVMWTHGLRGGKAEEFEYGQYQVFMGSAPISRVLAFVSLTVVGGFVAWWPGDWGVWARNGLLGLRGHGAGPTADDIENTKVVAVFEAKDAENHGVRCSMEVPEPYQWTAKSAVAGALTLLRNRHELSMTSGFGSPVAVLGKPGFQRMKDLGAVFTEL